MLSVSKNQIISVFLGIVLLSSVASFSPAPVNAQMPDFVCKWTQSFVTDDFVDTGSNQYDFIPEQDYTHVLPGITAYGGSFGMPELKGTVKFSYQYEGMDGLQEMTTREVDPEFGSGQPFHFAIPSNKWTGSYSNWNFSVKNTINFLLKTKN